MTKYPAVSVVIPMYNAEKYIDECLESLLAQTFQDFEVVVVDDCSTDNSVAVVENYAPKFNGRLKLSRLEKNCGTPAVPRNKGLQLSRGEYIFFVDADDLLTLTAMEELYTLAKNFEAEVVYCERFYFVDMNTGKVFISNDKKAALVDLPTWESKNLAQRVERILSKQIWLMPWNKFVRRNFLLENDLFFPHCKISEDDIWTYGLFFHTKNFLRVPNIVYVWRKLENSTMHSKRTPRETLICWLSPIVDGIKILDGMLGRIKFFIENPQYRCAVLEQLVHSKLTQLFKSSLELSTAEIFTAIKNNFGDKLGNHDVLISWLLADLITQQKIFVADRQKIAELEAQINNK